MSGGSLLTASQQVEHCKNKGITFNNISESTAEDYLIKRNTFYRIRAYRKNFSKNSQGLYTNLDFAHLVDLASIDCELRQILLDMTLNLEHALKLAVLSAVERYRPGDGYMIVQNFLGYYPDVAISVDNQKRSPYNDDMFNKFQKSAAMPIWVFVELISFSQLILLSKYTACYLSDKSLGKLANQMYDIKDVRNACAHDNCMINDLISKGRKHKSSYDVTQALGKIKIGKCSRDSKLANIRIYQITAILFFHQRIVKNINAQSNVTKRLHKLKNRLYEEFDYNNNNTISSFFDYLTKLIDNWYKLS